MPRAGQPGPAPGPALSAQSGFPSLSEASAAGGGLVLNGVATIAHPLQPYYEYLSYLFRRPSLPQGQEAMEIGYRDYLQVLPCFHLSHATSVCPFEKGRHHIVFCP